MPELIEARTRRGMEEMEEMSVSVVPEWWEEERVLNVPGKIMKPANRSHVLRPARMLWLVGMLSSSRSCRIYSVLGAGKVPVGCRVGCV